MYNKRSLFFATVIIILSFILAGCHSTKTNPQMGKQKFDSARVKAKNAQLKALKTISASEKRALKVAESDKARMIAANTQKVESKVTSRPTMIGYRLVLWNKKDVYHITVLNEKIYMPTSDDIGIEKGKAFTKTHDIGDVLGSFTEPDSLNQKTAVEIAKKYLQDNSITVKESGVEAIVFTFPRSADGENRPEIGVYSSKTLALSSGIMYGGRYRRQPLP